MSELRRWSDEGATREERLLLDSSRRERPDPAARAKTLAALGIGTPPKGGPPSGGGGVGPARRGGAVQLVALGAGVIALGVATMGAVWMARSRVPARASPTVAIPRPGDRSTAAPAAISAPRLAPPDPSAGEPAPLEPTPARRTKRPRRTLVGAPVGVAEELALLAPNEESGPSEPSLAEEVAALEAARTALAARDPGAALRLLERYRARFVHGKLSSEEVVLRVRALLARGDRASAIAVERGFSADHPDSPYVRRLRALSHRDGDSDSKEKK